MGLHANFLTNSLAESGSVFCIIHVISWHTCMLKIFKTLCNLQCQHTNFRNITNIVDTVVLTIQFPAKAPPEPQTLFDLKIQCLFIPMLDTHTTKQLKNENVRSRH